MPENINEFANSIIILLAIFCTCFVFFKIFYTRIKDRYTPIKTAKAQVIDKFAADHHTKIYSSMAKKPQYFVVFLIGNRKQSFRVSEFSYAGYKIKQQGTIKYKGTRLIEFH